MPKNFSLGYEMTINDELLNKLEKLSAIKISPDKREDTKRQLSEIVGFVEVLDELDLTNIDYAKHGQTPFRADVVNLGNLGLNSSGGVEKNSSDKVVDCFEQSSRNDGTEANSTNNSTKNSLIDDILAHAPKTDGQFFLVPKIIE